MMSLDLVLSPDLKTSSIKVSHLLKKMGGGYESLLLNLPREMEESVLELASEHISGDELIDKACRSRLIPEPVGSWEYALTSSSEYGIFRVIETLKPLAIFFSIGFLSPISALFRTISAGICIFIAVRA